MQIQTFEDRSKILKALGFNGFHDYFTSKTWLTIRHRVLVRDRHQCQVCHEQKATEVQHRRYDLETLNGTNLAQMCAICNDCRQMIEFDGHEKRSFDEILRVTNDLCPERMCVTKSARHQSATIPEFNVETQRKRTKKGSGGGRDGAKAEGKHTRRMIMEKNKVIFRPRLSDTPGDNSPKPHRSRFLLPDNPPKSPFEGQPQNDIGS